MLEITDQHQVWPAREIWPMVPEQRELILDHRPLLGQVRLTNSDPGSMTFAISDWTDKIVVAQLLYRIWSV